MMGAGNAAADGARPLVSVVIPTFNRPVETLAAIRSALAQTYRPIEIIVVDDASAEPFLAATLDTAGVALTVIRRQANAGASAARQTGVDAAKGVFVAFLDSDDTWLPHKLDSQLPLALEAGDDALAAVACGWESIEEQSGVVTQRMPVESRSVEDFASGCWFCPGATVVVAKRAFDIAGPFDAKLRRLEDLDWFLRFALKGGTLRVARTIGATVATGRRGRYGPVDAAARRLSDRFAAERNLTSRGQRRLEAYLELERAAAARNDDRPAQMLACLARSFLLVPRLTLPLKNWWTDISGGTS